MVPRDQHVRLEVADTAGQRTPSMEVGAGSSDGGFRPPASASPGNAHQAFCDEPGHEPDDGCARSLEQQHPGAIQVEPHHQAVLVGTGMGNRIGRLALATTRREEPVAVAAVQKLFSVVYARKGGA